MDTMKKLSFDEVSLAESSVAFKLSEIQKRCSELLDDPEPESGGLSLEDTNIVDPDKNCPYSRG